MFYHTRFTFPSLVIPEAMQMLGQEPCLLLIAWKRNSFAAIFHGFHFLGTAILSNPSGWLLLCLYLLLPGPIHIKTWNVLLNLVLKIIEDNEAALDKLAILHLWPKS